MKTTNRILRLTSSYTRGLILFLLLCVVVPANATPKKVLIYGPTHEVNGALDKLIANNPAEFAPVGQGSEIWSDTVWGSKQTSDFQAFDVIVIGDHHLQQASEWSAAIANAAVWSAALADDNIFLFGGDPEDHVLSDDPGAKILIDQGVRFAADASSPGPGLYVAFSDYGEYSGASLLASLGSFNITEGHREKVRILGSHPVTDCLREAELSDWINSSHSGFIDWPLNAGWVPVALVTDALVETASTHLPAGEHGLVHILARGSVKQFILTPVQSTKITGQQLTVTAKYRNAAGQAIANVPVIFDVTAGPNISRGPVAILTDANGVANWTYTGNEGAGRDTIIATVKDCAALCDVSPRVFCDWETPAEVSVVRYGSATIPEGGGGYVSSSFLISRLGSTTFPLSVFFYLGQDAVYPSDFNPQGCTMDMFYGGHVDIPANSDSAIIQIYAVNDNVHENFLESVILTLIPTAYYTIDPNASQANIGIYDDD